MRIPFNKPFMTDNELEYIRQAHANGHLAGDGAFTKRCHHWLETQTHCQKALLTHSCTAALEMAAILTDVKPGDEIIMPSYTFVSTANAFVLRGGVPVFIDIRPDTLNLDEKLIEIALTNKTKAIVPVHYAGVSCEMDAILRIADQNQLFVIEDAAQGIMSTYKGRPLGTLGHLGAYSFHETKNVIAGEGGALLVNDARFIENAEIIREKGTDRSKFFRGEVDKYTWQHVGSSFLPSELTAAFLWAQLEEAQSITARRLTLWQYYHTAFAPLEERGIVRRPIVPNECQHNAHMYYLIVESLAIRNQLLQRLKEQGIYAIFHYVPLHNSPAGQRYGRSHSTLPVTEALSERIVRLPLWVGLAEDTLEMIVQTVEKTLLGHS